MVHEYGPDKLAMVLQESQSARLVLVGEGSIADNIREHDRSETTPADWQTVILRHYVCPMIKRFAALGGFW
jgi:hypothetical protein